MSDDVTGGRELSPAARAAIAKYRRLMGNRAESEAASPDASGPGDPALERYLAERPPHHSPPRSEAPVRRRRPPMREPGAEL